MTLENRAVAKRLACLFCSIGTIGSYSYLIGGAGGYLLGKGRPFVALAGFVVGTVLAFVAIKFWRSYLEDVDALNARSAPPQDSEEEGA
ncbi:hypothetical protein LJC31_02680 [Synergistaceae bacterium OttesenSCG-928-I11]|nr:hypothetical protein [Synergistaceae bacterium OttesenSCG-928-I11]